jgi:DNA-binding transcriptional MerR regulator/DNA-directed RNA polymerase subunit RPC12/RpoP
MRLICYLRDLGIPIKTISQLFSEEDPGSLISLILEQQEKALEKEISEKNEQLNQLKGLIRELKSIESISMESIHDAAYIMSNKERLKQIHITVVTAGLPLSILQWVALYRGFFKGDWWLLLVWLVASIPFAVFWSRYYMRKVSYICPHCHTIFKPGKKEMLFANHTPTTRKLTCPQCNVHGFCVEVADEEDVSHA